MCVSCVVVAGVGLIMTRRTHSVLTKTPESKIFVGYDTGLYKLLSLAPDEIGDLLTWAIMTLPFGPFMRSLILGKGNKKDE